MGESAKYATELIAFLNFYPHNVIMIFSKRSLLLFACSFIFILQGCSQEKQQVATPPPPGVTVALPQIKNITNYVYFTGYTKARKFVELRARVEGDLEQVAFPSGGMVEEGDLLFVIDPKPYEAEVAQRLADLKTKQAGAKLAKATLKRKESSYKQRAVSELAVLEEKANVSKSDAEVMGAEAALTQAKLNLSYTEVLSPIKGRISRNLIDKGNLVGSGGDKTLLANIVNYNPIFVYFNIDERSLMAFKEHIKEVKPAKVDQSRLEINLALEGEKDYFRQGFIEYIDNQVDLATGTIMVRATFENADFFILSGQYAKVRIPIREVENAILVPEVALSADQRGRFLLTVDDKDTVVYNSVQIGALQNGMRVITNGLKPTDRVIVKGLQRARPGSAVTPKTENNSQHFPNTDTQQ